MTQKRPINADLPPAVPKSGSEPVAQAPPGEARKGEAAASSSTSKPSQASKTPRKPVPAALKAVAGLVVVAIVFLVAAVLGGGSSGDSGSSDSGNNAASPEEAGAYPASATKNTTRIEGEDSATIGANVALAVFPSTTPAQRPDAVTLVGEEADNAVAAAVLMASPIRTPLLISAASGNPPPTAEAVETLQPKGVTYARQGNASTDGPEAYAIGPVATPAVTAVRTNQSNGAVQAAEIAGLWESISREPPRHLVVAPEDDPAFAAPAAAWAARSGDPVLYSPVDELPEETAKVLRGHPDVPVYVLGPTSTISSTVVREIAAISGEVNRVSGETPVENAIALARYSRGSFGWNVNDPGHGFVIARSDAPLDAALAAPLSVSGAWGPLLLTDSADTLPAALRDYLLDVKPGYTTDPTRAFYNHVWIIGDQEAIDVKQQAEIDQLAELAQIGGAEP